MTFIDNGISKFLARIVKFSYWFTIACQISLHNARNPCFNTVKLNTIPGMNHILRIHPKRKLGLEERGVSREGEPELKTWHLTRKIPINLMEQNVFTEVIGLVKVVMMDVV